MITPQELAGAFKRNLGTIMNATEGLDHADCVLQPPVQGNCMNWVLGHILDNRNTVLQNLGQPPILTPEQAKRYGYGSEPVCAEGDDILKLDQMLALFEASQAAIELGLEQITPEALAAEVQSFLGATSQGFFLFFLYYHETYHLGQTELLRELACADQMS